MTISSIDVRRTFDGNGTTDAFATPYFVLDADLKVYVDSVLQTLSTDYILTGAGVAGGGTCTFTTPPPTGTANVVIIREPEATQGLDLVENDRNPAEAREQAFDKLTMIVQRLRDLLDRSVYLPDTVSGVNTELPTPEASTFLGWDSTGTALLNYAGTTGAPASVFMATVLDDTTAQAARATLKASGVHIAAARPAAADMSAGDLWFDSDYATGAMAEYYIVDPDDDTKDTLRAVVNTTDGVWLAPGNSEPIDVDCSAGGTITLSALENAYGVLNLTGTPGAPFNVVVDTSKRTRTTINGSDGVATVKTSAGTGVPVAAGTSRPVLCDGTNVVDPITGVSRYVMKTDVGSTGTEDGADTWAKLATIETTVGANAYFHGAYTVENIDGKGGAAEIEVNIRQLSGTGLLASDSTLQVISLTTPMLSHDSFKLVSSAEGATELWVQKKLTFGELSIYESAASSRFLVDTTYYDGAAWQSTAPTGTVEITSDWAGSGELTSTSLSNGWAGVMRYEKTADGLIISHLDILTVGTTADDTIIYQMPVGYRPDGYGVRAPLTGAAVTDGVGGFARIGQDGNIQVYAVNASVATPEVTFPAYRARN